MKNEGELLMIDEQKLGRYLMFIEDIAGNVLRDNDHVQFREEVAQDAFLKLYSANFFETNQLESSADENRTKAYLRMTVKSCYYDHLEKMGINKRRPLKEQKNGETKYEQFFYETTHDDESECTLAYESYTPEQIIMAKQAYEIIWMCYDHAVQSVMDQEKKLFFHALFWEFERYDLSVKALALHLGYKNSNPTQEFTRFVSKVSECTERDGITVATPHEQLELLRQIMN